MGVKSPTAQSVSEAVVRIRRRKLPDPSVIGNAGSFFKNPEVSHEVAEHLLNRHPGLTAHPGRAGLRKLSAGWMLEACGWKGHREGDAGCIAVLIRLKIYFDLIFLKIPEVFCHDDMKVAGKTLPVGGVMSIGFCF